MFQVEKAIASASDRFEDIVDAFDQSVGDAIVKDLQDILALALHPFIKAARYRLVKAKACWIQAESHPSACSRGFKRVKPPAGNYQPYCKGI